MDRYSFLQRILPPADLGNYVATIAAPNPEDPKVPIIYNRGFTDIETLANFCHGSSNRQLTAYFALGTFANNAEVNETTGKTKWRRKAEMATAFKTFAVDIDCGPTKPYPTATDGARALGAFLQATKLPAPMIVSSGYGLHCYWPLTKPISKDSWRKAADILKSLAAHHQLKIDESKVSDPAMVLRPLDTTNWKGQAGQPVKFLRDAQDNDPRDFVTQLVTLQKQVGVHMQAPAYQQVKREGLSPLAEALAATTDLPPADATKVLQKCAQLRRITFNHGTDASEPEWYAALGIAAFTETPEETAIEWSKGHPDYNENQTLAKLHQWKQAAGPTSCNQFDKTCANICSSCKFFGRIAGPVQLGHPEPKALTPTTDPTIPQPFDEPPQPFRRTEKGVMVDVDGVPLHICNYDLFPSHITRDPALGYDEVVWYWKKPYVGYTKFKARMSHIFMDAITELNNTLADNGLLVETKQKQVYLGAYMRAYVQKLQAAQPSTELHTSFGWKNNYHSFVIGSTEYRRESDGSVTQHEVGVSKAITDKQLDVAFDQKGNDQEWTTWTRALDAPGLELHQFALGTAFAAPLVALTGLQGFCLSLLGEGGEGKSVMQSWVNSVWGNPFRLGMKKEDTQLSIVQRMGIVANLPVTMDEMTLVDPAALANILYWSTQGMDKNRATESLANTWALPMVLSTNKSLRDKLAAVSADSDAISMRLLEFTFHRNSVFDDLHDYGRRISMMLRENYGHVGRKYIAGLLSIGAEKLREMIVAHTKVIEDRYGIKFAGKERYWMLAITLNDLGQQLAKQLGLIRYDFNKGTACAVRQMYSQREVVQEMSLDPYDMLSSYVNAHLDTVVTVIYNNNSKSWQYSDPLPRAEVYIRRELLRNTKGEIANGQLYIDRRHLQTWLVKHGFDFKKVKDQFDGDGVTYKPNNYGRYSLGKHTPLNSGQVPVVAMHLDHDRLKNMLGVEELEGNVVQLRGVGK